MPFVRKKTDSAGIERFYLVENSRIDGKIKQKVLAYLGRCPTPENALWVAAADLWFALGEKEQLDSKRVKQKLRWLVARVELLKRYADAPVCIPGGEHMDDRIQRFWRSLKIERDPTRWDLEYQL
jgi:hypothetical protein